MVKLNELILVLVMALPDDGRSRLQCVVGNFYKDNLYSEGLVHLGRILNEPNAPDLRR